MGTTPPISYFYVAADKFNNGEGREGKALFVSAIMFHNPNEQ